MSRSPAKSNSEREPRLTHPLETSHILHKIFSYLDLLSFFNVRKVSSEWWILTLPWQKVINEAPLSLTNHIRKIRLDPLLHNK